MPAEVNEAEWNFLVDYFSSDAFKQMSARNKTNKGKQEMNHICGRKSFQAVSFDARDSKTSKEANLQKLWEMTHMKSGHWVNVASAEFNDKLIEIVVEQIYEVEEGTDVDPIVNAAFVKLVSEKLGYCRDLGSGVKPASRRSMHVTQEQLQAQQKEVEEEHHKRESVKCKLTEVENQLEEERKK